MAAIRNSIQLQDRMTPVLRSIVKSMESTLVVMQKLDKQANKGTQSKAYRQATKDVNVATEALRRLQNQLIQVDNHAKLAGNSMSKMANSTSRISTGMGTLGGKGFNLVNLSAAFYLLQNIGSAINNMMKLPDEAVSLKARIGIFNESQYTPDQLVDEVYGTALKTRTGFEETGQLVTRIMVSGAMEGENAAVGAIRAAEIINKAIIAGGSTAEESRRSLLQLSQALASGMLQGDELRAIREQTPLLARTIGEGLAKLDPDKFAGVSIGQLKELGRQGELTSDRILQALFLMEDSTDEMFKQMPRTFGQATTTLGSLWMKFLKDANEDGGPLQRLTEYLWNFVDYLASEDGATVFDTIGIALNVIVDSLIWFFNVIGSVFTFLRQNVDLVRGALMALGVTAAIGLGVMFAGFVALNWPIIAVLAGLTAIFYAMTKLDKSTGDMLAGTLMFFIHIGNGLIELLRFFVAGVVWGTDQVKKLFSDAGDIVYDLGLGIIAGFATVIRAVVGILMDGIINLITFFDRQMINLLSSVETVATILDKVFGSNLAEGVHTYKVNAVNNLEEKIRVLREDVGLQLPEEIDWDKYKSDPTNNFVPKTWQEALDSVHNPTLTIEEYKNIVNSMGQDVDDRFAEFEKGISDAYEGIEGLFDPSKIQYNGGNIDKVDEVGKINSDVNLADEDIKLLRDIAAKQFLIQVQTIAPQVNANFGDVHETADVNDIMSEIERMVENAYSTTLIGN